ncbi:hypothetical protein F2Q69_00048369 [Brassica cretica]|uniref:Uncharacterized protein n=1 Tax=Brassica cretica TaxID=69181 RepID=A0A8S9PP69_BRACR|nr:hypothetical protein F2Q69_00048369 [Brassica cretica]
MLLFSCSVQALRFIISFLSCNFLCQSLKPCKIVVSKTLKRIFNNAQLIIIIIMTLFSIKLTFLRPVFIYRKTLDLETEVDKAEPKLLLNLPCESQLKVMIVECAASPRGYHMIEHVVTRETLMATYFRVLPTLVPCRT